ncbi:tetratricopeptide repeat protein [Streptomyces nigrescens]|uniref:tetratricopeptide repeat protein n=1 Tax=Streptomyces nigrescens TaxID=1920 RepID=UPI0036FF07EE
MNSEDPIAAAHQQLASLREEHGPAHPAVIEAWTNLAELTGKQGDHRAAAHHYRQLGDTLREHVGRFDGKVLDAYEGMARWVAGG